MKQEQVAVGLGWPEGPTVLDDGRVVFVETYRSHIGVWSPDAGASQYAFTGGGPNATALGADGSLYVTQNGGVVGPWRAREQRAPSIQRVAADGSVQTVCTEVAGIALQAPNDLAFGPDGRLYFTDPGRFDADLRPDPGYVFALSADGSGELVAELGATYPNGIVVEEDGSVVWVESYTRAILRHRPNGTTERVCTLADGHLPDGLAVAQDGRLYVTVTAAGGIDIVDPDGSAVEFVPLGVVPTNCAFSGSTLYVTDGGQTGTGDTADYGGVLWAVELDGVAGLPLFRGTVTPAPR
jgi:gluconolactonase